MTGKTHMAVGNAASFIIIQPKTVGELFLCIGAATVGSVICDIDIKGSGSRKILNKILAILFISSIALLFIEYKWQFGIYSSLSASLIRMLFGFVLFIGVCIYGKNKPHRSFMHSVLGTIIMGICTSIIIPQAAKYFIAAMISHIFIDMFNYKKVNLLYPSKYGASFGLCKADGIFNKVLFYVASLTGILYFFIYILK